MHMGSSGFISTYLMCTSLVQKRCCPILTGGIPLSFQLLAGVGVPTSITVSSSQPIEVNCNGSEDSIQQCQLVKFLQCSTGTIGGVNCTGMYNYMYLCCCTSTKKSCILPEQQLH